MTSLLAKQWIPSQTIFDLIHCESQWIKPKIVLKECLTLTAIQMLLIFFVILRLQNFQLYASQFHFITFYVLALYYSDVFAR